MLTFVLSLLLVVATVVAIGLAFKALGQSKEIENLSANAQAQRSKFDQDMKKWSDYASGLKAQNDQLARYRGIADADTKAKQILQQARVTLDRARAEAGSVTASARAEADAVTARAREEADALTAEAKREARDLKKAATDSLDTATRQASSVVEEANKRAEEIGGAAYDALKNADLYERAAKAMKNTVKGYGNEYVIPGQSLLDDLAEEFGNAQAGQELKKARDRTKAMIRTETAATCDYVETNRRDTAINFVVDAFNGKVDSTLSRVRHDNAGTLQQEIRDAFTLVNYNGQAFRNARISEEYLASRLDELKWAAIAQQLKLNEREEQRRIKEQIREEQKARREYERAMREAAKEEGMLRKAMEKARREVEQASDEQRAQYEEQLRELGQRLQEAEEKNQRALSMAQQTKKGYVYIISNIGSFGEEVYKIGLTRRLEPLDRVRELGDSSVPFEFDVHALIVSDDAPALEAQLHKHFLIMQMNKVNHRKEFFRVDLRQIREEVEALGIEARWTMMAEAREYRETLAIDKAITENPEMRDAWMKRQLELDLDLGLEDESEEDASAESAPVGASL